MSLIMNRPLFDASLLPLRRARAEAMEGDYFLHERAFAECLDRIATVRRRFRTALILGPSRPDWAQRLGEVGIDEVTVAESLHDDLPDMPPALCLSIGVFDTADELPTLLGTLRHVLEPGGLLIGAFAGGQSLPALRAAMAAADRVDGLARPHLHPMIDPPSFAGLLAGFADPVVDVDRVTLTYPGFDALVRDLRSMAATNRLLDRPRQTMSRAGLHAARQEFSGGAAPKQIVERIEIIHFSAWAPTSADAHLTA